MRKSVAVEGDQSCRVMAPNPKLCNPLRGSELCPAGIRANRWGQL